MAASLSVKSERITNVDDQKILEQIKPVAPVSGGTHYSCGLRSQLDPGRAEAGRPS
jgi:hypothetical protein